MYKGANWKEYAVSVLLVLVILAVFFIIKIYIIPVPGERDVLVIHMRELVFSVLIGVVINAVLLLARKPIILITVAAVAILSSLLCYGSLYSAIYVFAALCLLGSIPFIASLLAKLVRKV